MHMQEYIFKDWLTEKKSYYIAGIYTCFINLILLNRAICMLLPFVTGEETAIWTLNNQPKFM